MKEQRVCVTLAVAKHIPRLCPGGQRILAVRALRAAFEDNDRSFYKWDCDGSYEFEALIF